MVLVVFEKLSHYLGTVQILVDTFFIDENVLRLKCTITLKKVSSYFPAEMNHAIICDKMG